MNNFLKEVKQTRSLLKIHNNLYQRTLLQDISDLTDNVMIVSSLPKFQ